MKFLNNGWLRGTVFAVVNLWIVYHVFSIAIAPVGIPPTSPLLMDAALISRPYNEAMFLNHGYHFFAPDPGPSTLIEYTINREGDAPIKKRFPDVQTSPRLLYHRYFMLAENFQAFPAGTQEKVLEDYARHFSRQHDANEITLCRVVHETSSISRMLAGGKLDDEETYIVQPIAHYSFASADDETAEIEYLNWEFDEQEI